MGTPFTRRRLLAAALAAALAGCALECRDPAILVSRCRLLGLALRLGFGGQVATVLLKKT